MIAPFRTAGFSPKTCEEALDVLLNFSVKSILKKIKCMFMWVPLFTFTWSVD